MKNEKLTPTKITCSLMLILYIILFVNFITHMIHVLLVNFWCILLFFLCYADSLHEGYSVLRTIVMAYGGITPETPLTLSLSASRPTTHQTSSSFSTYEIPDHDTTANTTMPTTAVGSSQYPPPRPSSENIARVVEKHGVVPPQGHTNLVFMAQAWSRPSSSDGSSSVTPTHHRNGTRHVSSMHFSSYMYVVLVHCSWISAMKSTWNPCRHVDSTISMNTARWHLK